MLPAIHADVFQTQHGTRYLKRPGVIMLARPHTELEGVREFLRGFDPSLQFEEYLSDPVDLTDAENLLKFSGQLCYLSFTKDRTWNKDAKKYFDNIKASRHGSVIEHASFSFLVYGAPRSFCYTPEAQVLTDNGWLPVAQLQAGMQLLTLNPTTRKARWSPALSVHEFPYEGEVMGWSTSQMTSPFMTPDHLLWAAQHDLRRARGLTALENVQRHAGKVPFAELYGKAFVVQSVVVMEADHDPEVIKVGGHEYDAYDFYSWMGWVATDGGFSKERANRIVVYQAKAENLPKITALMTRLFGERWRRNGPHGASGQVTFAVHDQSLAEYVRQHIGPSKLERLFSRWLLDASPRLLRGFFNAALAGDGTTHPTNGHQCLYCPSAVAAGQYQFIAAKLGLAANVRVDDRVGQSHQIGADGPAVENQLVTYVIDLDRRGGAKLIRDHHQLKQRYAGSVYCPKTEDGIIYVKSTGQPFWCGNTHELVRHRQGVAYSQVSQRYVDGSCLRFVERPEYQADPQLHAAFESWIDRCVQEYNTRAELLLALQKGGLDLLTGEKKRDLRKKVNQCARSVLPNEVEAPIVVTTNLRALRHIIEMRADSPADIEIRAVAGMLYECALSFVPNLLDDYKRVELPDGVPALSTEHRKV
jgi:flavin-dependent thymidylate synthase